MAFLGRNKAYRAEESTIVLKMLTDPSAKALVKRLFLEEQRSPEQIANQVREENHAVQVSCSTIYRTIYSRILGEKKLFHSERVLFATISTRYNTSQERNGGNLR